MASELTRIRKWVAPETRQSDAATMRALLVAALAATVAGCAAPAAQTGTAAPAPRPQQTLFFDVTLIDLEPGKQIPDQSVLFAGT